jgi:SDR family mycofactocin-dependent oxidoreductase
MGKFDGRVALITGGARGQGRQHALSFAREGADIAICDIAGQLDSVGYPMGTLDDLAETQRLVEQEDRRCVSAQVDTRDFAALDAFVGQVVGELGRVDFAMANAGISSMAPVDTMAPEMWDEMIGTNLTGVFHTLRAVSPHMKRQGFGRIVATSSMLGRQGCANQVHYCASKWGVIGMVKSAALDLAPFGINVNAVAPGNVRTPMVLNDHLFSFFAGDGRTATLDDVLPALQSLHVLPVALVEPEDISNAVMFLCSEESRFITGATIDVAAGNNCRVTA